MDSPKQRKTFADALPCIEYFCTGHEGRIGIGKQHKCPFWLIAWDGGGTIYSDDRLEVDEAFQKTEIEVRKWINELNIDVNFPDFDASYKFSEQFPKIAKFIDHPRNRQWLEIGTGPTDEDIPHAKDFVCLKKGTDDINAFKKAPPQIDSVDEALRELELTL